MGGIGARVRNAALMLGVASLLVAACGRRFSTAGGASADESGGGTSSTEATAGDASDDSTEDGAIEPDVGDDPPAPKCADDHPDPDVAWMFRHDGAGMREDNGYGVAVGPDGSIVAVGFEWVEPDYGDYDILVIKLTPGGCVEWTRTFDGAPDAEESAYGSGDRGHDVAIANDGSIAVTGQIVVGNGDDYDLDAWVGRYSATGELEWWRSHDGDAHRWDYGLGVAFDSDQHVIMVGRTSGLSGGNFGDDILVRKFDPSGGPVWTRTYDGDLIASDGAWTVAVDSTDAIVVGGSVNSREENYPDLWVAKYSRDGDVEWLDVEGDPDTFSSVAGVAVDADDNVLITGMFDLPIHVGRFVRKYTPDGDELWTRQIVGPTEDFRDPDDIAIDVDGNIVLGGRVWLDFEGPDRVWSARYTSELDFIWEAEHLGIAGGSWGYDVATGPEGEVVTVGVERFQAPYENYDRGQDFWVGKYAGQ